MSRVGGRLALALVLGALTTHAALLHHLAADSPVNTLLAGGRGGAVVPVVVGLTFLALRVALNLGLPAVVGLLVGWRLTTAWARIGARRPPAQARAGRPVAHPFPSPDT